MKKKLLLILVADELRVLRNDQPPLFIMYPYDKLLNGIRCLTSLSRVQLDVGCF